MFVQRNVSVIHTTLGPQESREFYIEIYFVELKSIQVT